MKYQEITAAIVDMPGNFQMKKRETYINPENFLKLPTFLKTCENLENILIIPYLINISNGNIYELVYYKFEIEVTEFEESYYLNYEETNRLPDEITSYIKPKAFVSKHDKKFYVDAVQQYVHSLMNMTFECEIAKIPSLNEFKLYFQIY